MTCSKCGLSQAEHEAAIEQIMGLERDLRSKRSEVTRLRIQLEDSKSPENLKVRDICRHHEKLWKQTFPKARGITYAMDSTSAVAVRRALRFKFTPDEIKLVIDWVFASDFHRQKKAYLELDSILKDDKRIRDKLNRIDDERTPPQVWTPMERVLVALRDRGLRWDGLFVGEQEPGVTWKSTGQCPLCIGALRIGVRDNGWATLRCELACDFFRVLEALEIDPAELARSFDPATVQKPLGRAA